jgi:SAM-dependent methyltransferase
VPSEFDQYAKDYKDLLKDPLREKFAGDSNFFHLRKWILLRDFFRRRGIATAEASWLDLGCGKGELLSLGRESFSYVAGCDLSVEMMQACEGLEIRQQQDPRALPFPDASFDLVTAVCVYHHVELEDRSAITAEVRRVLKPGGTFAIIEHNPYNPVTQIIVKRAPIDANARLLNAGLTRSLLRSAGLRPIQTTYFLYFPEKLYQSLRIFESLAASIPLGGQYAVFGTKDA